jgi:predicted esterase
VLLLNGARDPLVPPDHPPRLAAHLRAGGADVTLTTMPHGHGLAPADLEAARIWLARTS